MKSVIWLCSLLSLTLLSGCTKDAEPLFELRYEGAVEIPAGLNPVESHFTRSAEIFTNLNAELTARGLTLEDIGAIQPVEVRISPEIGIFDYRTISEMNAFVLSIQDPNDRVEIGFAQAPQQFDRTVLQLIPGIADLTDFLAEGIIYLQLRFRLNTVTVSRTQHRVTVRFRVLAK
jgi:hypothetical protein